MSKLNFEDAPHTLLERVIEAYHLTAYNFPGIPFKDVGKYTLVGMLNNGKIVVFRETPTSGPEIFQAMADAPVKWVLFPNDLFASILQLDAFKAKRRTTPVASKDKEFLGELGGFANLAPQVLALLRDTITEVLQAEGFEAPVKPAETATTTTEA